MLDITLIREKPEWVKEQIDKLNDPGASERIDTILDLDQQRRSLLTDAEALQAHRNRLNKAMGPMRGNKNIEDATKVAMMRAATAMVQARDYDAALSALQSDAGTAPTNESDVNVAMNDLVAALREMSDQYNAYQERIRQVETELNHLMLWIPNLPHETVPVFD